MYEGTHTKDGREIIVREQAYGPHPRFGNFVPYKGITKVLLADDTEAYLCNECGHAESTIRQAASHKTGHADRKPNYPEKTLKTLVALVIEKSKTQSAYGRYIVVAEELNRRKIKTLNGRPWTAEQVSRLFNRYQYKYAPQVTPSPRKALSNDTSDVQTLSQQVYSLVQSTHALAHQVNQLVATAEKLQKDVQAALAVDDEMRAKAAKWDQLQKLMD